MDRVSIYLNTMGRTEEQFRFYGAIFGSEPYAIMRMADIPGQEPLPEDEKDALIHIEVEILGGAPVASNGSAPQADAGEAPAEGAEETESEEEAVVEETGESTAEGVEPDEEVVVVEEESADRAGGAGEEDRRECRIVHREVIRAGRPIGEPRRQLDRNNHVGEDDTSLSHARNDLEHPQDQGRRRPDRDRGRHHSHVGAAPRLPAA